MKEFLIFVMLSWGPAEHPTNHQEFSYIVQVEDGTFKERGKPTGCDLMPLYVSETSKIALFNNKQADRVVSRCNLID